MKLSYKLPFRSSRKKVPIKIPLHKKTSGENYEEFVRKYIEAFEKANDLVTTNKVEFLKDKK